MAEVAAGRVDLAVLVRPADGLPRGVRLVPLLDDPYRAVLPRGHRLAAERVLDLADLADEPWVGSERHGPCREVVLDACSAAGFTPGVVVESEDHATAQGFVAAGLGVALVPTLGLGGRHPGVVVRRIRKPEPVRVICAAVRGTSPVPPALQGLLDALRAAAER